MKQLRFLTAAFSAAFLAAVVLPLVGFVSWAGNRIHAAIVGHMANSGMILCANPMRSTDFRAIVEPVLNEAFDGVYDLRKDEWKQFMNQRTGIARARAPTPSTASNPSSGSNSPPRRKQSALIRSRSRT